MKCPACGHEKSDKQYYTDKVVRYKSGKKKGQIKEVQQDIIEPDKDKPCFLEIRDKLDQGLTREVPHYPYFNDFAEIKVCSCPMCGCLFVDVEKL